MNFRKTSRIVLTTLIVASACISTNASARRHAGDVARDLLLAPLIVPAAVIAASAPEPVYYEEAHYRPYRHHHYRSHRDHHYRPSRHHTPRHHTPRRHRR